MSEERYPLGRYFKVQGVLVFFALGSFGRWHWRLWILCRKWHCETPRVINDLIVWIERVFTMFLFSTYNDTSTITCRDVHISNKYHILSSISFERHPRVSFDPCKFYKKQPTAYCCKKSNDETTRSECSSHDLWLSNQHGSPIKARRPKTLVKESHVSHETYSGIRGVIPFIYTSLK